MNWFFRFNLVSGSIRFSGSSCAALSIIHRFNTIPYRCIQPHIVVLQFRGTISHSRVTIFPTLLDPILNLGSRRGGTWEHLKPQKSEERPPPH